MYNCFAMNIALSVLCTYELSLYGLITFFQMTADFETAISFIWKQLCEKRGMIVAKKRTGATEYR